MSILLNAKSFVFQKMSPAITQKSYNITNKGSHWSIIFWLYLFNCASYNITNGESHGSIIFWLSLFNCARHFQKCLPTSTPPPLPPVERHFQKMSYQYGERSQKMIVTYKLQQVVKSSRSNINRQYDHIDWIIFDYLLALVRHFEKCLTGERRCAKKDSKVLEGLKLYKIFVDLRNYSN